MATCHLLDLFVLLTSDDIGSCRVKRRNRPCLVCDADMDLVEVTQSLELFFMPICYNAKTMSFLDCPECAFSTSAESYEYLRICKNAGDLDSSSRRIDGEKSLSCSKCRSKLALHYQYCPTCGGRCNREIERRRTISFKDNVVGCAFIEDFLEKCTAPLDCGDFNDMVTPEAPESPLDSDCNDMIAPETSESLLDNDWDLVDEEEEQ